MTSAFCASIMLLAAFFLLIGALSTRRIAFFITYTDLLSLDRELGGMLGRMERKLSGLRHELMRQVRSHPASGAFDNVGEPFNDRA